MDIDVALVPAEARRWPDTVCIVIDELRASTTITTLLDLGVSTLFLSRSVEGARRIAREHRSILAGERHGTAPRGFDFDNSPAAVSRAPGVSGRSAVLSTSNGTAVLSRLQAMPAVIVGCLNNASAAAEAAVGLARSLGLGVGIVCAGVLGRFALDDAYAAGVIVERLVERCAAAGDRARLSDAASAARRLRAAYPSPLAALGESASGELVVRLGAGDDVPFCARLDSTATVGILRPGAPLRIERLRDAGSARVA